MEYMCTEFGVDSSRRLPVIAQTNRLTERPTHALGYAGVRSNA